MNAMQLMPPEQVKHPADPLTPRPYQVRERHKENADTFTLDMTPANGPASPAFAAGQFNMLYVFGVGEIPISISGDPGATDLLCHTTRAVGTVTRALSELRPGDMLGVRGPFGAAWPLAEATGRDVVIIAGGIGLAPLRSALYRMLAQREQYGKIVLLYGVRTQEDMLYRRELEQWRARFDLEVYLTVDRGTGRWRGNVGVVTTLIPHAPFDPSETLAMVCGPEVMMRFTVQALQVRGVAAERIYLSLERNMKCATGFCGHCQLGPHFICRDGPVFRYDRIQPFFGKWEI
jgi:NAD(P)H-flavin reductase